MTQDKETKENGTTEPGPVFTVMSPVEVDTLPSDHIGTQGIDNTAFEMESRRNSQTRHRRTDSKRSASHVQIVKSKVCCCIEVEKVFCFLNFINICRNIFILITCFKIHVCSGTRNTCIISLKVRS